MNKNMDTNIRDVYSSLEIMASPWYKTIHITDRNIEITQKNWEIFKDIKEFLYNSSANICVFYAISNGLAYKILECNEESLEIKYTVTSVIDFELNKENLIYKMFKEKETIINNNDEGIIPLIKDLKHEAYIPITYKGTVLGCVYLGAREEMLDLDFDKLEKLINHNLVKLIKLRNSIINKNAIINNIIFIYELFNEKSGFMSRHVYNVAAWATEIAKKLELSQERIADLYLAALMHDVGKIYIDKNILNKKGKLTKEEYEAMKNHVEMGYIITKKMFAPIGEVEIPTWTYQHHEKWDGTGYPNGLIGEEITLEGRILKVADSLDAIISSRSYKEYKDLGEAIEELKRCKGKDFDPYIADIAIELLKERINYTNIVIDDVILPGKLVVQTKDMDYTIDGFVSKVDSETIFKTLKPIKSIERCDIQSSTLSVEKLNIIFEFTAKTQKIYDYKFKIDKLSPKENESAFSLLWDLRGKILELSTGESNEISISKVSGNDIVFYIDEDEGIDDEKIHIIVAMFDDGTKIPLTGKIINKINLNKKTHYTFKFIGIKERYRDEIFRQLFRRQIEMRKLLSNIN